MKGLPPIEGFHAIIICDADPLVAIVQDDAVCLNPHLPLPVIIPDVIFRDATGGQVAAGRPDVAMAVFGWVNGHDAAVRIAVTEAGVLQDEMGWLPPSPDGIAMCQVSGVEATERKGRQP